MPLKAKTPTMIETRLKMLVFGEPAAGKSTFACQFPDAIYIDTERGCSQAGYKKMLLENNSVLLQSADVEEITTEIKTLLNEDHPYKTIVIDPMTTIYDTVLNHITNQESGEWGNHYSKTNQRMRRFCNLLLRLDMNIIITAHAKPDYASGMNATGTTHDGYKKLPYMFDLVLEAKKQGLSHIALVKKSRMEGFKEAETFEFSYDAIADRYGRDIIERDAAIEPLATPEQVQTLKGLIRKFNIPDAKVASTLTRANANEIEELSNEHITKWIDALQKKKEQQTN